MDPSNILIVANINDLKDVSRFKIIGTNNDSQDLQVSLKGLNFYRLNYSYDNTVKFYYANMNLYRFKILSERVSHGSIGLFGKLGYSTGGSDPLFTDGLTLSAHGPSKIVIDVYDTIYVRGYASTTAINCPNMKFYCDEDYIGSITQGGNKTERYKILPGKHLLTIDSDIAYCHSVWLFDIEEK